MILAIGIDSAEIDRFTRWTDWPPSKLARIFSEHEIEYSSATPVKTAERLAARWAAKEAFFKALHQMAPGNTIPLLTLCKLVSVQSNQKNAPNLTINWPILCDQINIYPFSEPRCLLSITHTSSIATAMVLIESK